MTLNPKPQTDAIYKVQNSSPSKNPYPQVHVITPKVLPFPFTSRFHMENQIATTITTIQYRRVPRPWQQTTPLKFHSLSSSFFTRFSSHDSLHFYNLKPRINPSSTHRLPHCSTASHLDRKFDIKTHEKYALFSLSRARALRPRSGHRIAYRRRRRRWCEPPGPGWAPPRRWPPPPTPSPAPPSSTEAPSSKTSPASTPSQQKNTPSTPSTPRRRHQQCKRASRGPPRQWPSAPSSPLRTEAEAARELAASGFFFFFFFYGCALGGEARRGEARRRESRGGGGRRGEASRGRRRRRNGWGDGRNGGDALAFWELNVGNLLRFESIFTTPPPVVSRVWKKFPFLCGGCRRV